ncbi:MAG: hypothetical protein HY050_00540 [Actinobacteria bacterium]|nr:hypothetical protein [Actinomycetota bacterium]
MKSKGEINRSGELLRKARSLDSSISTQEKLTATAIVRMRNYVETPKVSGYRAIHLVTERDGHRIEVQLRTKGQQAWANVVEKIGARYQVPLKDEIGPEELTYWLRLAAGNIAYKDRGEEPPASFGVEFSAALDIAPAWMEAEDTK